MRLLLPAFLLLLIVMFVMGVVVPRKSRRAQRWVQGQIAKAEHKGDESAGWLGDLAARCLALMRKATGASAKAGRATRDKIADGS